MIGDFERKLRIEFLPLQREVFGCDKNILILQGLEGSGKSFVQDYIALDKCVSNTNAVLLYVAPTYTQTYEAQKKIEERIYQSGLENIIKRSVKGKIELINGSILRFFGGVSIRSLKGYHTEIFKGKGRYITVVLDDATLLQPEIADAVLPTLLLSAGDKWRMIISCNPTSIDSWTYGYATKGLKDSPKIQTFTFRLEDNKFYNKETSEFLAELSPDLRRKFNARWIDNSVLFCIPAVLQQAIDETFSLKTLIAEPNYSYAGGWDLNNPLGEGKGRDRDRSVFAVIGKRVIDDKIDYKLVAYESFLNGSIDDFIDCTMRMNNLYHLEAVLIETPHSQGLYERMLKESLSAEIRLCNPFKSSNDERAFTLSNAFRYFREVLNLGWIKIPFSAKELIKELRSFRIVISEEGRELFKHKRRGHNDHIVAVAWTLLHLKDLQATGHPDYERISADNQSMPERIATGYDSAAFSIDENDREFLTPSKERFNTP